MLIYRKFDTKIKNALPRRAKEGRRVMNLVYIGILILLCFVSVSVLLISCTYALSRFITFYEKLSKLEAEQKSKSSNNDTLMSK